MASQTTVAFPTTRRQSQPQRRVTIGDFRVSEVEMEYLNRALAPNQHSYGPLSEEFETRFARLHGADFGLFLNSGTSTLHVALAALKELDSWSDWDEVIVPATTVVATANVILHNRLTPVFVDVDPRTFNIDVGVIEQAITPRTRCIIPVHLLGLPADMGPIGTLAKTYSLRVIEDSRESMFVDYQGEPVGGIGDVGYFSTHVAHNIVTGAGGMTITSDPELLRRMRSLINHGRDGAYIAATDDQGSQTDKFLDVSRRLHFELLGNGFRAIEIQAALGLGRLDRYQEILQARLTNARYLRHQLAAVTDQLQFQYVPPDRRHAYMVFGLKVRDGAKRPLVDFLELSGIETRNLLMLANQSVNRSTDIGSPENDYPISRQLIDKAFNIGCHHYPEQSDLDWVVEQFIRFFRGMYG